ncbi:MAG: DUF2330 domain-containing protein [bacterium]
MKKRLFILTCCLISISFIFGFQAQASIFAPGDDKHIWQAVERAVIVHENNDQTMIMSPLYEGDKTDFAWIIPTPSKLQINTIDYDLFSNLDTISNNDFSIYKDIIKDNIELSELEVDSENLYTINTFKFSETSDMLDWLDSKNYNLPENSNYLIQRYIQKDWYFNIIEVNSENIKEDMGFLPPLLISFISEDLIYPIKLKSLRLLWQDAMPGESGEGVKQVEDELKEGQTDFGADSTYPVDSLPETTKIDMYILSENRKTHADFETTFGKWLNKDQINSLSQDWYSCQSSKLFFTKMYSTINYIDYTNDLVFDDALDNQELLNSGTSPGSSKINIWLYFLVGFIFLALLFISPIGLSFAMGLYLTKQERAGIRKTTGLLLQGISLLSLISLVVFSYLLIWQGYLKDFGWDSVKFTLNNNYEFDENNIKYFVVSTLISQLLFLIWIIIIWVLQNKKKTKLVSHDGTTSKELNNHDEIGDHIFEKNINNKDYQDPEFEVELEKKSQTPKKSDEDLPTFKEEKAKSKIIKPKTKKIKVNKG